MNSNDSPKVSKFLRKLFKETSDPENPYIIWNNNGDKVCIPSKTEFIKKSISKISSTKDYSGFVRQMNMYGFYKLKTPEGKINDDSEEYYNVHFKRDDPDQMVLISREKSKKESGDHLGLQSVTSNAKIFNNIQYLANTNQKLSKEIESLNERLERQERTLQGLVDLLGKVFSSGVQSIKNDMDNSLLRRDYDVLPFQLSKNNSLKTEDVSQTYKQKWSDSVLKLGNNQEMIKQQTFSNRNLKNLPKLNSDVFLNNSVNSFNEDNNFIDSEKFLWPEFDLMNEQTPNIVKRTSKNNLFSEEINSFTNENIVKKDKSDSIDKNERPNIHDLYF